METNLQNLLNIFSGGITIWILCAGALLCLFIDAIWPQRMSPLVYAVGILTLIVTLVSCWYQWLHPEMLAPQDLLLIDLHSLFFISLVTVVAILTILNALGYMKLHQELTAEFCSLLLFSVIGMIFFFSSDHLLMNFIGLETMSLSIYVLVGSHKRNLKSNEAAAKYFIVGGVASAIFLYGIALFYGAFGTLKLSELAIVLPATGLEFLPKIALSFILVGVFFKIAVVPFHFWAPDVYEGSPSPVTGFMATGVKIASFGFALRVFMGINVLEMPQIQNLLVFTVIATFIVGNLVAIVQDDVKRMLAYSSISHAGFVLFGILAGFREGRYDAFSSHTVMFYLLGYLLMTLGAFAILSLMVKDKSETTNYSDLQGLGQHNPLLAGLFTLFMFSMVGMPGTVGFAAKYGIISLAVNNGHLSLAILAVIMSVISAFYYLRPSVAMFFHRDTRDFSVINETPFTTTISLTFCTFFVIYLGLNPDAFIKLTKLAAFPFV